MKICTIANKVKRGTGCNYLLRRGKYDTIFAEFCAVDWEDFDRIRAKALHTKGAEVEYHTYSKVVRVWTAEDWKTVTTNNAEAEKLVNGFWEVLHNFGREMAERYYKEHETDYARLKI